MDLLGYGSNAPNVTNTRPADSRVFGGNDTWGKDCSTPTAQDGTGIVAGFMNGVLGQLRALIRGNGQTAALADVVTADNTDDAMALKAIQQLIQRGLMKFAVDTGAADALVVALAPALVEYKAGLSLKVLAAHDNSGGAATINVSGLGPKPILRKGGGTLQKKDIAAAAILTLDYDGAAFQLGDLPAGYNRQAAIITSSGQHDISVSERAIALFRTAAVSAQGMTFPAGAENDHVILIEDVAGNLQAFPLTITLLGAGETIAGSANYVMNRNFQSTTFRLYDNGVTRIWSRSS